MALRTLALLAAIVTHFASSAQQITLQGQVTIHNSKYNTGEILYVDNAQVLADFTAPAVTDNQGNFTLEFVGFDGGTSVVVDVDKSDLEVVNDDDLEEVIIGRKTPIKIYMATKGQLNQSRAEIYKISLSALTASHEKRIAELESETADQEAVLAQMQEEFNKQLSSKSDAIELLKAQLDEQKKQLPKMARELAFINLDFASDLYIEAYEYFKNGEIDKVIEVLTGPELDTAASRAISAIEEARRITEKAELELKQVVESFQLKSKSHELKFEFQKAVAALEKAISYQKQSATNNTLVELMREAALLYKDLAQYDTALAMLLEVEGIQKELPENNHSMSITYDYISGVQAELGRYEDALASAIKSLDLAQKALDPDHLDVGEAHSALSVAYGKMRRWQEALPHQQEVIRIRTKSSDLDPEKLGGTYNQMANIQLNLGSVDSALHYMLKALDIEEEVLEPNHPKLARTYSNLGSVYRMKTEYKKAIDYHLKALQIREEVLEPHHPDLAMSHSNIAIEYRNIAGQNRRDGLEDAADEELSNALIHKEKCLEIAENVYQAGHPRLASFYNRAVSIYQELGKFEEALDYAQRTQEIYEQRLPPGHSRFADSYHNIAKLYLQMGNHQSDPENEDGDATLAQQHYQMALEYEQRTIEIDEQTLNENDALRSIALNAAAEICMQMEDYKQALEYAEKAIEVNLDKPLHPYLQTSYRSAGNALDALGRDKRALEFHEKADFIRDERKKQQEP